MKIYCCQCEKDVAANRVKGKYIYPHRIDLMSIDVWQCPTCSNYVGCHSKSKTPFKPLGVIPSKGLRIARTHIHRLLDPLWINKIITRDALYKLLAKSLGISEFHTAEIRTLEDARIVYKILKKIKSELYSTKRKYHEK